MTAATAPRDLLVRGDVVLPDRVLPDAVVAARGGSIAWVRRAEDVPRAERPAPPEPGTLVLPGLVDLHCHGGGGVSLPDATTLDDVRRAADEHLRHGTTTLVASLVTAPVDVLLARVALLADAADAGVVAGVHVEGPFLSHARRGAQHADDLLEGDADVVRRLADAARGHLRTMTVAPEVRGVADGDGDVLQALVAAGVTPSLGHTDATAEQVEHAVARAGVLLAAGSGGVPTATHLFNGMRPWHHRDPGPVAACLAAAGRGELVVELVADGTHLAPATVRAVLDLVGADAVALVTDAIAAAGTADGDYRLGPAQVRVAGGEARVLEPGPDGVLRPGPLAGGVRHLLDVVRGTVGAGVPLAVAVRAASATPARVLGRTDVGTLEVGRRADLVVTTPDLRPLRVARAGTWG